MFPQPKQHKVVQEEFFTTEYCCPTDSLEFHGGIKDFNNNVAIKIYKDKIHFCTASKFFRLETIKLKYGDIKEISINYEEGEPAYKFFLNEMDKHRR